MEEHENNILTDEEIGPRVVGLVKEAEKYTMMITPYIKLWGHVKDAFRQAIGKGVEVTVVVRDDPKVLDGEDIAWLLEVGVKVFKVENLHAKIFVNERQLIFGSWNLTESALKNSHEIALACRDNGIEKSVRGYINATIKPMVKPVASTPSAYAQRVAKAQAPLHSRAATGSCIRCGSRIDFDPHRPLCAACFDEWANWENEDYPELFCHHCGKPAQVSYRKPLCDDCYRS